MLPKLEDKVISDEQFSQLPLEQKLLEQKSNFSQPQGKPG